MLDSGEMLKGVEPDYRDKNFKEWLKSFCSKHHWDIGGQCNILSDEDEDGYVKPTLKLFFYNVYKELTGWTPFYRLRMKCQRVFRKNGLSDNMIWDADYTLSVYAYKVIKAYKKSERHGYPSCFSEYNENEWKTKEEYEQAVEEGKILGGGSEAWDAILDHILMALEYKVIDGNFKKQSEWFIKHFGMDPYDDNKCNENIHYTYRNIDEKKGIACTSSSKMPDLEKVEWCKKTVSYFNHELTKYAEEIVQDGFELLGKFWQNLWD